jgi:uncharacterized protein YegP (UPF0339 family)
LPGTYVISKTKNGKFTFNLRAGNNQVILTSQPYAMKRGATQGVESVRNNGPKDARFERKTAKDGTVYFVLTATNGEVIGKSQMYASAATMENGIASVKKNAADAKVVDRTGE